MICLSQGGLRSLSASGLVECFGDVTSPRDYASVAKIKDKVWLYGGLYPNRVDNGNMYELKCFRSTITVTR